MVLDEEYDGMFSIETVWKVAILVPNFFNIRGVKDDFFVFGRFGFGKY